MEQRDRERALIKFRNGSYQILLATDLAARGIDIPSLTFIIHYHLPLRKEEFIHRNGRTARMNRQGTAYVIAWKEEKLPDFIEELKLNELTFNTSDSEITPKFALSHAPNDVKWITLFISGGRKDKISKKISLGCFINTGN